MSLLDGLRHRLHVLLRGDDYAREVERELHFHVELEALSQARDGQADAEREVVARRLLGNLTYYREEVRHMTLLRWLDRIRQDAAYARRGLERSPGFTIAVVLTLGLGIGVNAAMFSLLDQLFVRPPSGVVAPNEIRRLYHEVSSPTESGGRLAVEIFNYPYYRAILRADSTLRIAGFTTPDSTAIVNGEARIPIRRSRVIGNYFELLGVRPERGRFFVAEEGRIERPTYVAVLSDAFWRSAYGGDPALVGKTVTIGSRPYVVVGITPKEFTGVDLDATDVWIPANTYPSTTEPWYETFHGPFSLIARIPNGGAEQRMTAVGTAALRSVHIRGFTYDSTVSMVAGSIIRAVGPARRANEISISTRLAGVALIVLLIACANVANLLLVRATRRGREIAVRRALGVSTARLYQQLLTESVVLSFLGGVTAVVFAVWAGTALRRLMLPNIHWAHGAIGGRAIAFAAVVSLIMGIVAGLAPALQATRPNLVNSLKAGSREGSYQRSTLRSALLAAQAALSVVLLIGAGLFVRSLDNVRSLDLGYDVERVLVVTPMFTGTQPESEIAAAFPAIAQRLRAAPGVEAVGYASAAPMDGYSDQKLFLPDRDSLPRFGDERGASKIGVSPDYFRASGVRLIEGRDFDATDRPETSNAVIVSQNMARLYWPGQSALGKCIIRGARTAPCSIVVGVVADVHRRTVVEKPTLQYYVPVDASGFNGPSDLVVRTSEQSMVAVSQIASQDLKRAFPRMSIPRIRSMQRMLEPQFRPWRLGATLFTAFGVLALIVAAIGVYSVVAFGVSQRMHEMGIRVALGARLTDIVGLVLRESSRIVAAGVVLGVLAALGLGRLVASLLFGISARDPLVIASAAGVLLAVGLAASLVPGWRAATVDPGTALRAD